jgi:hypothetical protein
MRSTRNPHAFAFALLLLSATVGGLVTAYHGRVAAAPPIPTQLTDEQFWQLSSSLSEPDGYFRSDNLLSNELNFQHVIPELLKTTKPGRVYLGVGPEQNLTYIAALKPSMAFIIDIRHGNLDVHLMYKALFELSANRAEFVSRLFSRKQPEGLNAQSTAGDLFLAYLNAEPSQALYEANLKAIADHLKTKHKFPLSDGDLEGIEWALSNYYKHGPEIYYNSSDATSAPNIVGAIGNIGGRGRNYVTYADLMMADDGTGQERSYLANDENFVVLKELHTRNLIIPVVGDFGGSKAIRELGKYLKSIDAKVAAFYLSNVENYLSQDGKTIDFLSNVASLPIDESSRFIRTGGGARRFGGGAGGMNYSQLGNMLEETSPFRQ